MDSFLGFIISIMPFLHIIAGLVIIVKIGFVASKRGFDLPAIMLSFFRVYSKSDRVMTQNTARLQYMKINNYLNYYLYIWLFLTIMILVIFQRLY